MVLLDVFETYNKERKQNSHNKQYKEEVRCKKVKVYTNVKFLGIDFYQSSPPATLFASLVIRFGTCTIFFIEK